MRTGMMILLFASTPVAADDASLPETAGDAMNVEFSIQDAAGVPTLEFRQGETVRFVFRVQNNARETQRLAYTFPPHDVAVVSASGDPVFSAWNGKMFAQVMRVEAVPPGESLEFFIEWKLESNDGVAVPPGDYRVETEFNAFVQPGNVQLSLDAPHANITVTEAGDLQ
ncbi:MAG TPA: BsuPI-related putative proteinase inhibitor [Gammaproteobacteria bacterium]